MIYGRADTTTQNQDAGIDGEEATGAEIAAAELVARQKTDEEEKKKKKKKREAA